MIPDLAWLEHFHFLRPWWALLLLPWIAVFYVQYRAANQPDRFGGIIAPHLLEHLRLPRFRSRWFNPRSFTVLFVGLLLIVLMGPTWRQQPSPLSEDEAALVILLDVSASMQQRDIQPSRLRRAKQKISDLLALRPDKKAALLVYAGSAHTVLTLTADRDVMQQYLAAITTDIMPRSGKFPEYALPLVDDVLRETSAPATVLLLADGTGADSRAAFAAWFRERQHQLLVLGVGQETVAEGQLPLERRALQALASAGGGEYVELSVDDSDVRRMNRRINSHYVVLEDAALPWLDSGYPLLFPAMAVFLLWFRRGWTLTLSLLLVPTLLLTSPPPALASEATEDAAPLQRARQWFTGLWLTPDQQGRLLMQRGHYAQAAQRFDNPLWKGMAHYYNEEFMLAAAYFSRSDSAAALFNEANARAHARDYVRALARYDRLLQSHPDYPGAQQNRDRVQAIVDEINRLSESQVEEQGVGTTEIEPGEDQPIAAEGAETLDWEKAEIEQLTAEQILQDPATGEMWLRGVQQDPARFLATKFSMQLTTGNAGSGETPP